MYLPRVRRVTSVRRESLTALVSAAVPHRVVSEAVSPRDDAIAALQRPKLERYGATLFAVLRPARYVDATDKVEFGELHVFIGKNFDEIEDQLFDGDLGVSRRIYELSREVIEFQRATQPLLGHACGPGRRVRQVRGRDRAAASSARRSRSRHSLLQNALSVQSTLVGQRQNEEMRHLTAASLEQNEEVKKISAWAAILFAPTLVGTVYGMNFESMPELGWALGYPMALTAMVVTSVILFAVFKRRQWL